MKYCRDVRPSSGRAQATCWLDRPRTSFVSQAGDVQALCDCIAAYLAVSLGQFEVEVPEWPFGYAQDRPTGVS